MRAASPLEAILYFSCEAGFEYIVGTKNADNLEMEVMRYWIGFNFRLMNNGVPIDD